MQAMEQAIPKDLQNPYAITVQSSAVDDRCGSIAITQPMQYTVVNVNCLITPGILVDVCRELRSGHKAVVEEVHAMTRQLSQREDEMHRKLSQGEEQMNRMHQKLSTMENKHEETCAALTNQLRLIVQQLTTNGTETTKPALDNHCSKQGCRRIVTKRFRSGKLHRQCSDCIHNK
jgi:hypothetical protein